MKTGAERRSILRLTHPSRTHVQWALLWVAGIALLWGWDLLFLNGPAFAQVRAALYNSLLAGSWWWCSR
jgi:hypothetical protein